MATADPDPPGYETVAPPLRSKLTYSWERGGGDKT